MSATASKRRPKKVSRSSRNQVLQAFRGEFAIVPKNSPARPTQFLIDPDKVEDPPRLTGSPELARRYSDRSGAFRFLKSHPHLRKVLKPKRIM